MEGKVAPDWLNIGGGGLVVFSRSEAFVDELRYDNDVVGTLRAILGT